MPLRLPLLAAALALATPTLAEDAAAEPALRVTETVLGQVNPRSLAVDARLRQRWPLYRDARPWLAQNHAQIEGAVTVSPATASPALGVELQPLSVLALGAAYEPIAFLGTSGLAQSYPSPRARLGGGALEATRAGPGGSYALLLHQLVLRGALQAQVGDVAARAEITAARVEAALHGGDRVVYHPVYDLLVYRRGWVAEGDLDLAWFASDRLLLGLRQAVLAAWYPPAAAPPGEARLRSRTTARLGPLVRWTLFRGRGGLADEGALIASAQWWLAHPDRAGRTSPQAVPLALLALQLSGTP